MPKIINVPNVITVIRLIMIPFIALSIYHEEYMITLILFTISGVSDVLDGYIARKYNLISDFGKLMDPLADKATQIITLLMLTIKEVVPIYILLIVCAKEFIQLIGALFLLTSRRYVVFANRYGKISSVFFYGVIVVSIVLTSIGKSKFSNANHYIHIIYILMVAALVPMMAALLNYTKSFFVISKEVEKTDIHLETINTQKKPDEKKS